MSLIETATRRPVRVALACAALATLAACGGRERPQADLAAAQVNTIGVNSYLWRSALETFSFAPLLQADAMLVGPHPRLDGQRQVGVGERRVGGRNHYGLVRQSAESGRTGQGNGNHP